MTWNHRRGLAPLLAATERFGVPIHWEARSLREFEDVPVADLAARYDLIAVDHPHVGQAAATGAFLPLDGALPAGVLDAQRAGSVGPSFASYTWQGRQWALPMDAAAQVSAYRPDLLPAPPRRWDEALELLRDGAVTGLLPANPTHLWSSFLSLCHQHASLAAGPAVSGGSGPSGGPGVVDAAGPDSRPDWWPADGIEPDVAAGALTQLRAVLAVADPASLDSDPIQVLDEMATGDRIGYAPLIFGYVNYARPTAGRRLVRFADAPSASGAPVGTMLGGVGLAVSARCADPDAALRFAAAVVDPAFQAGGYASAGGQPGHRAAWTDPAVNAASTDFFVATLSTLDRSFLRGRDAGYPAFQRAAGEALHAGIRRGDGDREILAAIRQRWQRR
ncbi:extracellular solute-binding protein [Actinocatenispora sera]|uniref:extracellular solute-binding protein n=1 Tax=Actinocatenispora sera TaxID=390989 RepID=UPI003409A7B0